jgi:hypothetical protein
MWRTYIIVFAVTTFLLAPKSLSWAGKSAGDGESMPEFIGAFSTQEAAENAIDASQANLPPTKRSSSRYSVVKEKSGESFTYIVQLYEDSGKPEKVLPDGPPNRVKKRMCGSLSNFLYAMGSVKPEDGCIYVGDDPIIAAQSTSDGLLVYSLVGPVDAPRFIYIYKDNPADKNTVDNQRIEPGYFEYRGIFSYQSDSGERSVYSFSRVK